MHEIRDGLGRLAREAADAATLRADAEHQGFDAAKANGEPFAGSIDAGQRYETIYDAFGIAPAPRDIGKPGRPRGSGRAIPTADYLRGEYRRVWKQKGRQPTQRELAENMKNARDGGTGVAESTLRAAISEFRTGWPIE